MKNGVRPVAEDDKKPIWRVIFNGREVPVDWSDEVTARTQLQLLERRAKENGRGR